MTKDLEQDLHNIFSAIFSGRKENKSFMEDFRIVINTLNKYTECAKAKIKEELTKQIEFNNESST